MLFNNDNNSNLYYYTKMIFSYGIQILHLASNFTILSIFYIKIIILTNL